MLKSPCLPTQVLNYKKDGTSFWDMVHINPVSDKMARRPTARPPQRSAAPHCGPHVGLRRFSHLSILFLSAFPNRVPHGFTPRTYNINVPFTGLIRWPGSAQGKVRRIIMVHKEVGAGEVEAHKVQKTAPTRAHSRVVRIRRAHSRSWVALQPCQFPI